MIKFEAIYQLALDHKGSVAAVEEELPTPLNDSELMQIDDDRWLSAMTKCIFQAGFVWKIIHNKWPDFEKAFDGFHPRYWAQVSPEVLETLAQDKRIVRNAQKINTVPANAQMIRDILVEGASGQSYQNFSAWLAQYDAANMHELYDFLKKNGSRLGGNSPMYLMRLMGKDTYIFSQDVVAALIREGVIDKAPTSKKAKLAINEAFYQWHQESGRSLSEISRILAMTVHN
jgi:3-methyladenine DNA glycosylase Tag